MQTRTIELDDKMKTTITNADFRKSSLAPLESDHDLVVPTAIELKGIPSVI